MKMSTLLAVQDQTSQTAVAANLPLHSNHLPSYSLPLEKSTVKLTLNRYSAFTPNQKNIPANFYLPNALSDYRLTAFSATAGFKISVLKCHYPQHFKRFTQQLAAIDNLQALTYHPAA